MMCLVILQLGFYENLSLVSSRRHRTGGRRE
jgi:hypothetical protein